MPIRELFRKKTLRSEPPRRPDLDSEDLYAIPVHDESNWLLSYADMMTLLCIFFILLFSMTHLDAPQYERVKKAMAHQFHGQYVKPNEDLAKFVNHVVDESGVQKEASVRYDARGVAITFESTVFFGTSSSEVSPAGRKILLKLIQALHDREQNELKKYKIAVEGHTDNRPIVGGIYPTNWELSAARAARVVRLFLDGGFDAGRMTAIAYADTRPEVPSRAPSGEWDEAALAKNRRVVLRILDPSQDSVPLPEAVEPGEVYGPQAEH